MDAATKMISDETLLNLKEFNRLTLNEKMECLKSQTDRTLNRLAAEICFNWRYRDGKYYYENHEQMKWVQITDEWLFQPIPPDIKLKPTFCDNQVVDLAKKYGMKVDFKDVDYARSVVISSIIVANERRR